MEKQNEFLEAVVSAKPRPSPHIPFSQKRILVQMNPEDLLLWTFLLLLICQSSGQRWWVEVSPSPGAGESLEGLSSSIRIICLPLWMAMQVAGPLEGAASGGVCIPPQAWDDRTPDPLPASSSALTPPEPRSPLITASPEPPLMTSSAMSHSGHFTLRNKATEAVSSSYSQLPSRDASCDSCVSEWRLCSLQAPLQSG